MPDQDTFKALALIGPRRHSLAVWVWSALLLADAVLLTRRMSGQFTAPLPTAIATLSSLLIAITSLAAWYLYESVSRPPATRLQTLAPQAISLTITAIWCWSLAVATGPLAVGVLFSIALLQLAVLAASSESVLGEASPLVARPEPLTKAATLVPQPEAPIVPSFAVKDEDAFIEEAAPTIEETAETDEGLTLWLSRRTTEGAEQIEGWVRVDFVAGQRETVVHVAFCPPLPGLPEIETEDLEGADLEIRVAAAFAFGARLSVRRSGAVHESNTVRVGFVAQAAAVNRAA